MGSEFSEQNPYQAPSVGGVALESPLLLLKKFRSQIHALGGFWIVVAVLNGVAAAFIAGLPSTGEMEGLNFVIAGVLGVFALAWAMIGILTCLKKIPAVYIGLVLSYIALVTSVVNFSICPVLLYGAAILQAHRVIGWAKELKRTGIPLNAIPVKF